MRKRKSGAENLFVSTAEEINRPVRRRSQPEKLAERVGITEQHLSRLLPRPPS